MLAVDDLEIGQYVTVNKIEQPGYTGPLEPALVGVVGGHIYKIEEINLPYLLVTLLYNNNPFLIDTRLWKLQKVNPSFVKKYTQLFKVASAPRY